MRDNVLIFLKHYVGPDQNQGAVLLGRKAGEIKCFLVHTGDNEFSHMCSLFCRVEGAEYEIYIGNFPVCFTEKDLRDLFADHNIEVGVIRLKQDMEKV